MKNIFFDMEFTGLHQNTTPISIGMVSDCGKILYLEFDDYDLNMVDDWIKVNVTNQLWIQNPEIDTEQESLTYEVVTIGDARDFVIDWLSQFDEKLQFISDCLAYDWVLFCELFGGAFGVPDNIYYIPMDLSTAFYMKGIDPDVSRKEFSGIDLPAHNAMNDAIMIKVCWEKLRNE